MKITHWKHRPLHIYSNDLLYFITGGTIQKQHVLATDAHKEKFSSVLSDIVVTYSFKLVYWMVLNNHYHFIAEASRSNELGEFINRLHSKSALELNNLDQSRGRRVWYQYWDVCIRNEKQYLGFANYILWNPVKHGYVQEPERYKYSSFYSSTIVTADKEAPELLEFDKF